MIVDGTTLVILLLLLASALGLVTVLNRRACAEPAATGVVQKTSRSARIRETIVIAIWFGLMTSMVHLLLAFVNWKVRHRFVTVSPDIVWMAPAAWVVMFGLFAATFSVVTLVLPRLPSRRAAIAWFAWLGVFGLLVPFHQLHQVAVATIAAGVSSQLTRLITCRPVYWRRVMRSTSLAVAGLVVALAVGFRGWSALSERWAMSQLTAPPAGAPNVLILVMDTVRAGNLSLYGYARPTTPELSRRAAEGTTFDMAFSTSPWTLKSHATMFTGLFPSQIAGDFQHPVNAPQPMLAEIFRDRGYATGGFVANLPYTSRESGLARGFVHYDDYRFEPKQIIMHTWLAHTPIFMDLARSRSLADVVRAARRPSLTFEANNFNARAYRRRTAAELNASFLAWRDANESRPFFAFINYFDAHAIYRAPPEFARRLALPDQPEMGRYDGAIAYIDQEIGRLLDGLSRRGILDNTIVIVTADHGEQFGEHGLRLHANSLYLPLLHVPLVIRYPSHVAQGVRVHTPVSLRDLAATVADLAGLGRVVSIPGISLAQLSGAAGNVHGSSLFAEVERAVRPEPEAPTRFGPMRALIAGRFHYIRRGDGQEELYDYESDPSEIRDLAKTLRGREKIADLPATFGMQ